MTLGHTQQPLVAINACELRLGLASFSGALESSQSRAVRNFVWTKYQTHFP